MPLRTAIPGLLALLLSFTASAAVLEVGNGAYATIGDALAVAAAGDEILVHPGTYAENVVLGAAVTLHSVGGSGATVIDAPVTNDPCIQVDVNGCTVAGFTLAGGDYGLDVAQGLTDLAVSDLVVGETGTYQVRLTPALVAPTLAGLTLVNHASGQKDAVSVRTGTLDSSATWPLLPAGFVYVLDVSTLTVRGAAGPVLTLLPGTVVKSGFGSIDIGAAAIPGGLMADGVIFTSLMDDEVADTNGSTQAPGPGNWYNVEFLAGARADSCAVTNCEFRYGATSGAALIIRGGDPVVTGNVFTENRGCLSVVATANGGANISGNVLNQSTGLPFSTVISALDQILSANTLNLRTDDVSNGIELLNSTLETSYTLPVLPNDFCYVLNNATLKVLGAAGPVLTIPSGTIVKSLFGSIEIGSSSQPGGLVADGVIFTSYYDDEGGDTNNAGNTPNAGNWYSLNFKAAARADSCIVRNGEIRYGGTGPAAVILDAPGVTVADNLFRDNSTSLQLAAAGDDAAAISGNTFQQGSSLPLNTALDGLDNLLGQNTIIPRGDNVANGIRLLNSTVTASRSLPVLPHGFCYVMSSATLAVAGPQAPVLTIPSGVIVKSLFSDIQVGSNTEPGGLMADGVVFTSFYDDVGGDTNAAGNVPASGNWYAINFGAQARADSCAVTNSEIRYGGTGPAALIVSGGDPVLSGNVLNDNSTALQVSAASPGWTGFSGNTVTQGTSYPYKLIPQVVRGVLDGNALTLRGDGKYNAIALLNSVIAENMSLPLPTLGMVYVLDGKTIGVYGPNAPTLDLEPGTVFKMRWTVIHAGSTTERGAIRGKNLVFTSIRDDSVGGDTDDSTIAPQPGDWYYMDFRAGNLGIHGLLEGCDFRYGGNFYGSMVNVDAGEPRFLDCTFTESAAAAVRVRGGSPEFLSCRFGDSAVGLRLDGGLPRVESSCFDGNATYGVEFVSSGPGGGDFTATDCWWGDASGPSGVGVGTGDAVTANVVFAPWAVAPVCDDLLVAVDGAPAVFAVAPAYPNPFNPSTTLRFELPREGRAEVEILDLKGRRVALLVDGVLPAGAHDVAWTGRADDGRAVPAGAYFFRVRAAGETRSGRLMLLK
ncbi:MAG TPA: FlgD immunoglobulin-like domain containing protein [Candidatus Krumholzibacteria bacterium]|nr:FlgD immunoglobulin-like domain containing protein [Candidatus Krumholzibacteria bacterium]HRX51391.1 FlgD immunoglobulin-like domain containing protein [Candidatus Krumholzibacteria bacterium]